MLSKTIESVLEQTFTDWELIIVDDGSTDHTKELVERFIQKDSRINYIYQENAERSAARNNGIRNAIGEYICFLDSDDYYLPKKLSALKSALDELGKPKVLLYDGILFEIKNQRSKKVIPKKKENESILDFLVKNTLFPQQICGEKSIFEKHKYNPKLSIGEDVELWTRIAVDFDFLPTDSHQTVIVDHDNRSVNFNSDNVCKQLKTTEVMFRKGHPGNNVSKKIKNSMIAGINLRCAYGFILKNELLKALTKCLVSLLRTPNFQTKHKILVIMLILSNQRNKLKRLVKNE